MRTIRTTTAAAAVALSVAVGTTVVGAGTAGAVPRNPCQDLLNQYKADIADAWDLIDSGLILTQTGNTTNATKAFDNARFLIQRANNAASQYESECGG